MLADSLTREIYGNIDATSKGIFYALAAVALLVFAHGLYRRVRLWRLGRPDPARIDWRGTFRRLFSHVLSLRTLRGSRPRASLAHRLLFYGFLVLTIGTLLIAVEHVAASVAGRQPDDPLFHKGTYFAIYELVMDIFGLALLVGCSWFLLRRASLAGDKTGSAASIGRHWTDRLLLTALLLIGLSGYLVEGLRILWAATPEPGYSPAGLLAAEGFQAIGVTASSAETIHFVLWWCHAVMALGFIALFPHTRLLHAIAGAIQLATVTRQPGQMQPVSIDQVEETGIIGVGRLVDFHRHQLRELDACVSCGRCQDACPAHEAGKPLSPRDLVQDLRAALDQAAPLLIRGEEGGQLHGETILPDTLWSCTTCMACVAVCPLGISPLDMITDMRRHLVGEGKLRGSPATALQKVQRSGNPWGLPAEDRFNWREGLEVPTVGENPDFELLYWVGCAAAYDRRTQKIARAVVQLLASAEVNFAVLGSEERCSGDFVRRMGDEFLFQELAAGNIATLDSHGLASPSPRRQIITHCPHCLNSLVNDYPQFGGHYEVLHHSQYLAALVERGKLEVRESVAREITFHDPCYLARAQNITEEPRQLVQITGNLVEMKRRRQQTSCCGAGGGRMWFDDGPEQRVGVSRVTEALETGAETVAVSCPFCLTMMTDGVAAQDADVEVKDVAELLLEGLVEKSSLVKA
jgi:Fe-S oxidoreductase/nitrate reductase gamma subunit